MAEHVLVTGAAGHVGRAVLALLAQRRVRVTALVLHPEAALPAARVVTGDACDPAVVADAMTGVDGVVHLAALPSPRLGTPEEVFTTNTRATFVVLEEAGRRGVRRAVIAGSYAAGGLPFAVRRQSPPYLPVDTATPLLATDPYALSKQVDEVTAAMMARRHEMTVVALRLPFVGDAAEKLPATAARYAERPESGAADVWSYLDTRDAARALALSLSVAEPGCHTLYVAAPETLSAVPTERLLDRYHPGVPRRRRLQGRTVPIDLEPARRVLGFTAEYVFPLK